LKFKKIIDLIFTIPELFGPAASYCNIFGGITQEIRIYYLSISMYRDFHFSGVGALAP
jgi:hypothetical protein